MKKIISILFIGLFAAGCATSRYDVRVAPVPNGQGLGDWVAVRTDRQTGQAWYCFKQGSYVAGNVTEGRGHVVAGNKPEWHPILGGVESAQK